MVVPEPILLDVTDSAWRILNILVVLIFAESLVSRFNDFIKFCKDPGIHASEFEAFVSSGDPTTGRRDIPRFDHICAMKGQMDVVP